MNATATPPADDAIIRVFCVDDHAIFLEGLRGFFGIMANKGERIAFAGSAQDAQQALTEIARVRPDILLLDVWLSRKPGSTGLDLLRNLRASQNDIPVIAYSGIQMAEAQLQEFLELDLDGYLLKDGNPQTILAAVLKVMEGESYFCQEIQPVLRRVRAKMSAQSQAHLATDAVLPFHLLSQQERIVLQHILKGVPRKDIADSLNIARTSIDTYRRRIFHKLEIQDFSDLDIPRVLQQLDGF